jgi:hypothetical protein
VGFCLADHQRVNRRIGPRSPVYNDAHGRAFCQKYHPDALSVWEGVSAGWRDLYERKLTLQWVDVSDVQPGVYWLREDVDPHHIVTEAGPRNRPAYAASPTTVPGYDAQGIAVGSMAPSKPKAIILQARRYGPTGPALFRISTPPAHGTLNVNVGALLKHATVIYRPTRGYHGPDRFTYSAQDAASSYPRVHCQATVSMYIGAHSKHRLRVLGGCTLNASLVSLSDGWGVQQNPRIAFGSDAATPASRRLVWSQLEFACTLMP